MAPLPSPLAGEGEGEGDHAREQAKGLGALAAIQELERVEEAIRAALGGDDAPSP